MKKENWFRELTDLEVQNINGGRNGDGNREIQARNKAARQKQAMKDAADFARKYNTNVGCTSNPLHYSDSGCNKIGAIAGQVAGVFSGGGLAGVGVGSAVGSAVSAACQSSNSGKGGSIGGSCSSSSSSSHCSSNGGFGGGSCRW